MAQKKKKDSKFNGVDLSREEMISIIKELSGNTAIVGNKEITELCTINRIETGIPIIDFQLGGGITEGRITILAGNPSSGKSTNTLYIIKALIDRWKAAGEKKFVLYFDVENSYDTAYATAIGIDQDYVSIMETKVIEDAFQKADALISAGFIGAMVIDSLDGMICKKVDDNAYAHTMGGTAGALAMHLPNLYSKISEFNVTTIIIKQARVKLDAYGAKGEVITFSGGKALRHFADTILILKRKSNNKLTYTPVSCKAEKTRSSRMGLTLDIPFGTIGIDIERCLFQLAQAHGIVSTAGAGWTSFGEFRIQGEDNFVAAIKSNPDLYNAIREKVYNELIYVYDIIGQSDSDEIVVELDGSDGSEE